MPQMNILEILFEFFCSNPTNIFDNVAQVN